MMISAQAVEKQISATLMGSSQRNNRDSENSQIAYGRKCFLLLFILAQCRPEEVSSEHGPIAPPAFSHLRLCTADQPGHSAIRCPS